MPSHIGTILDKLRHTEAAEQAKYRECATSAFANLKTSAMIGASVGILDNVWRMYPKILWRRPYFAARVAAANTPQWTLSFVAGNAAFRGAKCSLAVARGVDDRINAGIAGGACGFVVGLVGRVNFQATASTSLLFGVLCALDYMPETRG